MPPPGPLRDKIHALYHELKNTHYIPVLSSFPLASTALLTITKGPWSSGLLRELVGLQGSWLGAFAQVSAPPWPRRAVSLYQTPHEKVVISVWLSSLERVAPCPPFSTALKNLSDWTTTNVGHVCIHIHTYMHTYIPIFFFTEENELVNFNIFLQTFSHLMWNSHL